MRPREFSFGHDAACELVFVNGHFAPELSKLGQLPRGVTVRPLASAISGNSEVKDSLVSPGEYRRQSVRRARTPDSFTMALMCICRSNTTLAGPIHLLFILHRQ